MNQPRIARQRRNEPPKSGRSFRSVFLLLVAVLILWAGQARAQQTLGDLVEEAGLNWMVGRWATTTDEGDRIQLIYRWQLDRHLATIQFKTPDFEYYGMIFYIPAKEEVVQVGADNRGGSGKGLWEPDGDKAVMKIEHTGTDGETNRMGLVHSKVNAETMKMELCAVDSAGELAEEPWATLEFKRQRTKARKKDK